MNQLEITTAIYTFRHTIHTPHQRKNSRKQDNLNSDTLSRDTWLLNTQTTLTTNRNQLEHIINTLYRKIRILSNKYCKVVQDSKHQTPWWTPELDIERKRVGALRRRFQRAPPPLRPTFKEIYLTAHKEHKKNIKTAKTKSWRSFCAQVFKNIFTLPYKITLNKKKKNYSNLPHPQTR